MLESFGIDKKIVSLVEDAQRSLSSSFEYVDVLSEYNTFKVIDAFRKENIGAHHFSASNGYGYSDAGRDALARVFARIFGVDSAVVSPHIACGTHAIALALYAVLRPSDTLISVTGRPYDTLNEVIGKPESDTGSLIDLGVEYMQVDLNEQGKIDIEEVLKAASQCSSPKVVFLQRSRGYEWRSALSMNEIEQFSKNIKEAYPDIIIIVDNCYGEFCEKTEPTQHGADLIAGSLIKNPGGGLAPTGGYIAGRQDLISLVENRLVCPGLGGEVGSYEASYRPFFQGMFMAPHVVGEALKGSMLSAKVFEMLGYDVYPSSDALRSDITQSVKLNDKELLLAYTRGIQSASAVDSRAVPEPWDMPGYSDKIVMAAGTFVQGSSIELSADAPIKPPYIVYAQGGLSYSHMKLGLMIALSEMNIVK